MQSLKINRLRSGFSLRIAILTVCVLLVAGPASAQPSSTDQAVTLIDSFKVRVRSTPEILPDNILASLMKGTQLQMTGQEGDWYRVTLPDARTGWVHSDYGKVEEPRDQLEVTYGAVKVRAEPTTNSASQGRVRKGQRLHLLEKVDDWYRVQIPNETEGWVREDLVTPRLLAPNSPPDQDQQSALLGTEPEATAEIGESAQPGELQPAAVTEEVKPTEEVEPDDLSAAPDSPEVVTTPDTSSQVPERQPLASDTIPAEYTNVVSDVGSDWLTIMGFAGLLVLAALIVFTVLRRRRHPSIHRASKKVSTEKRRLERNLRREIKEARNELDSLEKKAAKRLEDFRNVTGESQALSSKTSDDLLSSLEEMKKIIENQQNRLDLYSELVSLQSEQIEAYKKETASIRKLLEIGNTAKGKE